jgi:hypothetical protein
VSERLRLARRGVRGGVQGAEPPVRGSGVAPPNFFFSGRHIFVGPTYFRDDIFPGRHITGTTYFRDHMILGGFSAHGFCRWFSISG